MLDLAIPVFFIYGSFAWWSLAVFSICLALWAIEKENGVGLTFVFIAFFITCGIFGDFNILNWAYLNPITAAAVFGLYFLCGAGWALFKFSLFAAERKDQFDDMREAWLSNRGVDGNVVPEELKGEFSEHLMKPGSGWAYRVGFKDVKDEDGKTLDRIEVRKIRPYPVWRENKAKATRWAAAWPLSMFLTFFSDFFRVIFRRIMNSMGKLADAISRGRFAGTEDNYLEHEAIIAKKMEEVKEKKEKQSMFN